MALKGTAQMDLLGAMHAAGLHAVGISGQDAEMLRAHQTAAGRDRWTGGRFRLRRRHRSGRSEIAAPSHRRRLRARGRAVHRRCESTSFEHECRHGRGIDRGRARRRKIFLRRQSAGPSLESGRSEQSAAAGRSRESRGARKIRRDPGRNETEDRRGARRARRRCRTAFTSSPAFFPTRFSRKFSPTKAAARCSSRNIRANHEGSRVAARCSSNIPSVSGSEKRVWPICLSTRLARMVSMCNAKATASGSRSARGEGPHLLLVSHIDTVPPCEGWSGDPFQAAARRRKVDRPRRE